MIDIKLTKSTHYENFEVKNGPQDEKCTIKINFKRTNGIRDDDVNHKSKHFWREMKKTIFLNHIFDLYPYRFTQISS
jgi:hypothetical protein